MIRSASLALAMALAIAPGLAPLDAELHAQAALATQSAVDSVIPADAELAASRAVASAWGVAADRVALAWSPLARGTRIPEGADVELLGTGLDGWWVVSLIGATGQQARVRVRAGLITPASVAARPLPRGHELAEEDILLAETVAWGPPALPELARPGWTVRRALLAGDPLVSPAVEPPVFVRSGDAVEVSLDRGSIVLTLEGVALGTAREGERLRVRASTGRLVHGVAVAPGRVRAGDPR